MKKILLLLSLGFYFQFVAAQNVPSYSVTAYDSTSTGYYFFCPYLLDGFFSNFPPGTQWQMILDGKGDLVYYKEFTGYFAGDFKVHSNGLMSYTGNNKFYFMDSTFTIIDSVSTVGGITFDLHDVQILPNGHYLLLGLEDIPTDLSIYPMFLGNNTPGSVNGIVRAGVVQELDVNKNVVYEWHSIDHFNFEDVDKFFLLDTTLVDWTHMNNIELDFDGNIMLSSRHFNEITKISRTDSSVIWRFGGNANQFTFINDTIQFLSQHDIRRLPNGNVTLFDNGRYLNPIHPAVAKEYQLDENTLEATLVWSHHEDDTIFSRSQGNVQRLANGNTLISYGDLQPVNIVFNVVDSLQNKIFELAFDDTLITYRTFNYPTLPWSFNRPEINCSTAGGQSFLDAGPGHASYLWSTGETTQVIQVMDTGGYQVFVPVGNGGFISSEKFIVTDTNDICNTVGILAMDQDTRLNIYPNPGTSELFISGFPVLVKTTDLELIDLSGRMMIRTILTPGTELARMDVGAIPSGMYIVRLENKYYPYIKF